MGSGICRVGRGKNNLQHPVLRWVDALDETRFVGTPLTAQLVVVEMKLLQRRHSTEGRGNRTYGTEAAKGRQSRLG